MIPLCHIYWCIKQWLFELVSNGISYTPTSMTFSGAEPPNRGTRLHGQHPDAHPGGQRDLGALREVEPILGAADHPEGCEKHGENHRP